VSHVVSDLGPVHVEIIIPAERLAVSHVVEVEQPTLGRHVLVVARVVLRDEAHAAGHVRLHAEDIEDHVVERGFAADAEVLVEGLHSGEPVAGYAIRITADQSLHLGVGLQRNAGAQIVAVVVLDVAVHHPGDDPLPVLIERGSGLRSRR
jgi:hypothetical protein